ncbi:MAG TPA: hypothetical protein VHP11_13865 [Tepidisphaeraceae bacterium]|nr:hypothetical protein [Tepidisphaeraceae bacterium]
MPMGPNENDTNAGPGKRRHLFVGLSLVMVTLVFVVAAGTVWCRSWWWRPVAPSSILVVEGSKEFEGTRIIIEGTTLRLPLKARISQEKSFVCRFPLLSGEYLVRVEYTDGTCWLERVRMEEHQYAWMSRARLEDCRNQLLRKMEERRQENGAEGISRG